MEVVITYPDPIPAGARYFKYGPTPERPAPHWYAFEHARISGNTVTLTDGQTGDDDLSANGIISDPGGLAFPRDPEEGGDDDDNNTGGPGGDDGDDTGPGDGGSTGPSDGNNGEGNGTKPEATIQPVPGLGTWAMLLSSLLLMAGARTRRLRPRR